MLKKDFDPIEFENLLEKIKKDDALTSAQKSELLSKIRIERAERSRSRNRFNHYRMFVKPYTTSQAKKDYAEAALMAQLRNASSSIATEQYKKTETLLSFEEIEERNDDAPIQQRSKKIFVWVMCGIGAYILIALIVSAFLG